MKIKCPQCKLNSFWRLSDGRLKCKSCKIKFSLPQKIDRPLLKKIIAEFVLEHSTNIILERINISKHKLLEILILLRMAMTCDVPAVFSGIVEVDETYLGGRMKNRRLKEKVKLGKNRRGFGTIKQPVFGILCREGKVWAEIVSDTEARDLQP